MKISGKIREIITKHPKVSYLGYNVIKEIWNIKANFINYEYPKQQKNANISYENVLDYNKNRIFGPKKRICYAPFNNLHFKINGEVASCSFNKNHSIGNIHQNTIHELWFSNETNELRTLLSNYNFQKCASCKFALLSEDYRSFPPTKYDYFSSDDSVYPTQMSFELSNLCNLECIMCNEELSSSIAKTKGIRQINETYPSNFIHQLKEFIPHLSIATFIGGEPLLIKKYYEIWETIIQINPKCNIHLQTNATVLPDKFLDLLNKGKFEIGISIDGCTKSTVEKIRKNAKFEDIEKNIERLVRLKEEGKIYLHFNFCPLTENWEEIPKMVDYANFHCISLKILNVEEPRNLSLLFQNSVDIQQIFNYLNQFKFDSDSYNFTQKRNIETYNSFVKKVTNLLESAKKRDAFIKENALLSLDKLVEIFAMEYYNNQLISYLSDIEKNQIINQTIEYVKQKTKSEKRAVFIINQFRYFIYEIENEVDNQLCFEQAFLSIKKVINDFSLLSLNIS